MTTTAVWWGRLFGALAFLLALVCGAEAHAQKSAPAQPQPQPPALLDTPRRSVDSFLRAGAQADWALASESLDLRLVRADQRRTRSLELAEQLYAVLRRAVWIDVDGLPDEPTLKDEAKTYRVATVPLAGRDVPLTMALVPSGKDKEPRWLWSGGTVSLVPQLYDQYGPGVIESRLPASITRVRLGRVALWQWAGVVAALPVGYLFGRIAAFFMYVLAKRVTKRTRAKWDDELVESLRGPAGLFSTLVVFRVLLEPLTLPASLVGVVGTALKVGFIGVLGLAAMRVTRVISKTVEARAGEVLAAQETMTGVLRARGVTTQVRVLRRVLNITIGVLSLALMLLQFETVRNVGVSLLASAGLAGVILGLATQRTIGSLVAGIHLSATQPIRIGDEVVVEGEWGVIEEITLTFVVIRIWDERRLVVPMTRFFEQPFENWTKVSAQIHGTVMLYADPALPVDALRGELDRFLVREPLWDRRTQRVQVTDASERSMTLRVLVSARSAGEMFTLRTNVREHLLGWLASYEGGRYMVRLRLEEPADRDARGALVAG